MFSAFFRHQQSEDANEELEQPYSDRQSRQDQQPQNRRGAADAATAAPISDWVKNQRVSLIQQQTLQL